MDVMTSSAVLGKVYSDGEVIVRQGELGDCMYVVEHGRVELLRRQADQEYCVAVLESGDFFGERAVFEKEARATATARSLGGAIVLKVEKRTFLQRVHEDPSFVFTLLRKMSWRIQQLEDMLERAADTYPLETASLRGDSRVDSSRKQKAG